MALALPVTQHESPTDLVTPTVIAETPTTSLATTDLQNPVDAVVQVAASAPERSVATQAKDVAIQRKLDRQSRRAEREAQAPSARKAAADRPRRSAAAPAKEPAAVSSETRTRATRTSASAAVTIVERDRREGHRG